MSSPLRTALRARLRTALRDRDRGAAAALRTTLAALDNAEAVPPHATGPRVTSEHVAGSVVGLGAGDHPRRLLTVAEEHAEVARELAEMRGSAELLAAAGDHARAEELLRAARVVEEALAG